jgi:hypothetical protein
MDQQLGTKHMQQYGTPTTEIPRNIARKYAPHTAHISSGRRKYAQLVEANNGGLVLCRLVESTTAMLNSTQQKQKSMQEQQRWRNSGAEEVTPLIMSKVWGPPKTDTVYQYATKQNIMKI